MAEPDPLEEFYAAHPEFRPGAAAGAAVGNIFKTPGAATPPPVAKPAAAPAGPPPVPEGWRPSPTPGQIIRNDGFASMSLDPKTNQYTPDKYAPSAATLAAAGITKGGGGTSSRTGTGTRDFNAEKAANLQAGGATSALPKGFYQVDATRATNGITVATFDPSTRLWVNSGFPPNKTDMTIARQNAMRDTAARTSGTTPPATYSPGSTTTTLNPGDILLGRERGSSTVSPGVAGAAGLPGTVQGSQAPLLPSFADSRVPGLGVPTEGLRMMSTGPEMNTLVRSMNGPPISVIPPGLRPEGGGHINNYTFGGAERGGQPSPGVSPAYAQFPNTPFMVPEGYQRGASGFGAGGDPNAFQAFSVPIGVTGPTATSPGGAGMLTLQGPQNATIGNTGFSLSPFAYNSFGATYGRNLSDDAATRAVETAMLLDAQRTYGPAGAMALLTTVDPGSYTGQPGLYGNFALPGAGVRTDSGYIFGGSDMGDYSPFERMAGGGRVLSGPLGTSGPKSMVTNEPIIGVGVYSHQPRFIVGEDNADPGMAPNREMLTFHRGMMDVKPLEPFAGGGQVYSGPPQMPSIFVNPQAAFMWAAAMKGISPRPELEGVAPMGRVYGWYPGFDTGGTISIGSYLGGLAEDELARLAEEQRLNNDYGPIRAYVTEIPNYVPGIVYAPAPAGPLPGYGFTLPVPSDAIPIYDYGSDRGETYGGSLPLGVQAFAGGGTVATAPGTATRWWMGDDGSIVDNSSGINYEGFGYTEVNQDGSPYTPPPPPTATPPPSTTPPPTTTPPPATPPSLPPLNVPPMVTNTAAPTFDPFNANILAPWQTALNQYNNQQAQREAYQYRRAAGNLGREVGVQVLPGQTPTGLAGPGRFWDYGPQIQEQIGNITGLQSQLQALGPAENPQSIYERAAYVGSALDALDKIENLELQKVGAIAAGNVPSASDGNIASWQAQLEQLGPKIGAILSMPKETWTQFTYEEYNDLNKQVAYLEGLIQSAQQQGTNSLDKASVIQAQIDALKGILPQGVSKSALMTEKQQIDAKLTRNQSIINKTNEVANLAKMGVPNLSGPALPVRAAA